MDIRFDVVDGPASEPVTVAELKAHAKIDADDEDETLLPGYIKSAREQVERKTGRCLLEQTWSASLDKWPELEDGAKHRRIRLAGFPVISIDSVTVDGVTIASSYYRLNGKDLLVSVEVDDSEGEIDDEGIVIEFACGYGAVSDLPDNLVQAVKMLAAHYYDARGATSPQGIYHQLIPEGVQALLQPLIVLDVI